MSGAEGTLNRALFLGTLLNDASSSESESDTLRGDSLLVWIVSGIAELTIKKRMCKDVNYIVVLTYSISSLKYFMIVLSLAPYLYIIG